MADNFAYADITAKILKAYFEVYNTLGYGFLEKVYENAMLIELRPQGLACDCQIPIDVIYENNRVGFYVADIIVENVVIIELKAAEAICEAHEAKLINYLRATDIEVGLLLNFGKKNRIQTKSLFLRTQAS
jgi:GxxExxY protein